MNLPDSNATGEVRVTPAAELSRLVGSLLQDVTPGGLLVGSDFDGTLSPIVSRPEAAGPQPSALEVLARLTELGVTVVVISGRSLEALHRVVPVPGVRLLGDYGLAEPSAADELALTRFNAAVAPLVDELPGVVLETKPGSTSVHYRGLPEAGPGLLKAIEPVAAELGLRAGAGRMVVEIRPPGADKGEALRRLLEAERPAAVAFAGDDEGDRSAFLAAAEHPRHLVVGVRSAESRADLFEHCDAVLDGPAAWVLLLERLAEALVAK